jgi:hypothetical protein
LIPLLLDLILVFVGPDVLPFMVLITPILILELLKGLIKAIPDLLIFIPLLIKNLVLSVVEAAKDLIGLGVDIVVFIWKGVVQAFDLFANIRAIIYPYFDKAFSVLVDYAREWGKDLIDNFVEGIKNRA